MKFFIFSIPLESAGFADELQGTPSLQGLEIPMAVRGRTSRRDRPVEAIGKTAACASLAFLDMRLLSFRQVGSVIGQWNRYPRCNACQVLCHKA